MNGLILDDLFNKVWSLLTSEKTRNIFFSILVFFHNYSQITRLQEKSEFP